MSEFKKWFCYREDLSLCDVSLKSQKKKLDIFNYIKIKMLKFIKQLKY